MRILSRQNDFVMMSFRDFPRLDIDWCYHQGVNVGGFSVLCFQIFFVVAVCDLVHSVDTKHGLCNCYQHLEI